MGVLRGRVTGRERGTLNLMEGMVKMERGGRVGIKWCCAVLCGSIVTATIIPYMESTGQEFDRKEMFGKDFRGWVS